MTKVIGIIAIKGGVGKTTVSASLAADLVNHYGKKVLLVDGNYSAPNLGLHMDVVSPVKTIHHVLDGKTKMENAIHKRFGVDIIPGSYVYQKTLNYMKLKDRINRLKENYDFVIVDSSPSLNEEVLSVMLASDELFVVSTPDYPTLVGSLRAAMLAKQRGRNIRGIILNKVRDPKYELTLEEIEGATDIPVVARIADDGTAVRALFTKIPIPIYDRRSKFAKEISKLSGALINVKEKRAFWKDLFGLDFKREEVNREVLKESLYSSVFKS